MTENEFHFSLLLPFNNFIMIYGAEFYKEILTQRHSLRQQTRKSTYCKHYIKYKTSHK